MDYRTEFAPVSRMLSRAVPPSGAGMMPCRDDLAAGRPATNPDAIRGRGRLVCLVVSRFLGVSLGELGSRSRGKASACLSRQVAMYLMHTSFSSPYQEVAEFFRRDRTTVSHACRLVEDMRDDRAFDRRLAEMEELLAAAREIACSGPGAA